MARSTHGFGRGFAASAVVGLVVAAQIATAAGAMAASSALARSEPRPVAMSVSAYCRATSDISNVIRIGAIGMSMADMGPDDWHWFDDLLAKVRVSIASSCGRSASVTTVGTQRVPVPSAFNPSLRRSI
jgi:hypothetical protein